MAVKRKTITKVKAIKKKWFKILASPVFNRRVIGESYVSDINQIVGRTVEDNLMNITNNIKNKNVSVKFKITGVEGDTAATEVIGYAISPSSIKRFVRAGKNKVDYSFVCKSLDEKKVRVKIFLLTIAKTNASVLSLLRKNAREFLTEKIGKMKYNDFFKDLVGYKVQIELKNTLKKVYPLKTAEIRMFNMITEKETSEVKKKEAPKKKEAEEKETKKKTAKKEKAPAEEEAPQKEEKPEETKEPAEKESKE